MAASGAVLLVQNAGHAVDPRCINPAREKVKITRAGVVLSDDFIANLSRNFQMRFRELAVWRQQ